FECSNAACVLQPWMFDVQVISTSPSQNPIVSPYQRGTAGPSRGTPPFGTSSMLNSRPMWMFVMKFRATPPKNCTSFGVTSTDCSQSADSCQRRKKPSGQQYCDGHCGLFVWPWW